MVVVFRLGGIARLTLAAGLTVAVIPTVAVAQLPSHWFLPSESYFDDGCRPQQALDRSTADGQLAAHQFVMPVSAEQVTIQELCDCSTDSGCGGSGCGGSCCGDSCCGDSCCGGCGCGGCGCNACCSPCWTCVAGTEMTFLVPEIDDGSVDAVFDDNGTVRTVDNDSFDLHGMTYAPRVWVGMKRGCWGVVGRFWHLDTSDSGRDTFELDGFGYDLDSDLEMQTIDLEATRDICLRGRRVTGSFGVRYASFDHSNNLNTIGQSDDDDVILTNSSYFRQFARGTGLTGSLNGTSPICGTRVSWFYNVRGSCLWGHIDTVAETAATFGAGFGNGASVNGAAARVDDPFIIVESQIGLMGEHRLQCYPADAFVRVAFEFQHWNGDESQVSSTSFAGVGAPPTSISTTNAFTAGLDTNLIGFSIGTGLTY